VRVERDPIFIREGTVWTSAGVTAGIDLALAMIEEDHGPELALRTARELVMFLKRPGGQAQFSAELKAQETRSPPIRRVQEWVLANPMADLTVAALAERAVMSPRNFTRLFAAETGSTPAAFVEEVRVERARRLLEGTAMPIEEVADRSGFRSGDVLRRVFLRRLGTTPGDYRDRFASGEATLPPILSGDTRHAPAK
jgi:transcriptional regulator GlxA family with amidase domain